jgi:hypothetical protein
VSKSIAFVAFNDLHLTSPSIGDLDLIANPIAGLNKDIDGQNRNPQYPYKGADENVGTPLPVTLLYFNGSISNKNVVLNWATSSAKNNRGFFVERKQFGDESFASITFVKSNAINSNVIANYQYIDVDADLRSTVYYRLRQVDIDGSFKYSDVIAVSESDNNKVEIKLFPNPIADYGVVELNTTAGEAQLDVIDLNGQTLHTLNVNCSDGLNTILMNDLNRLNAGIYVLRINNNGVYHYLKFVKL